MKIKSNVLSDVRNSEKIERILASNEHVAEHVNRGNERKETRNEQFRSSARRGTTVRNSRRNKIR